MVEHVSKIAVLIEVVTVMMGVSSGRYSVVRGGWHALIRMPVNGDHSLRKRWREQRHQQNREYGNRAAPEKNFAH
jgi:hypothetical protein